MKQFKWFLVPVLTLCLLVLAKADDAERALRVFKESRGTAQFFDKAIGYAVFPTIGRAGLVVGGAFGEGVVYKQGETIGKSEMSQITIGLQAGAQAYSQIIFFEDERALKDFVESEFEFGAEASAVAITAGASARAGSTGSSAGMSTEKDNSDLASQWYRGMAVFTVAKGGLMYQATIGGQTFKFKPK